jgi:hypothetical protein
VTEEQWIERPSEEVREDAGNQISAVMTDSGEFVVGPGVLQAMEDAGDEPRSDEQFIVMAPGHQVSQTFGRDAVYYYYEEDNRTQRLPFR